MQNRSDVWKSLAATGAFRLETVAEIGGKPYTSISAPIINRALISDALSVGNCVSATLQFSLLTQDVIPKSSEIIIRKRLAENDTYSEWLPSGTFYISQRTSDPVTGLLTFLCYDAMLKTNAAYPITKQSEAEFPKPMENAIQEIADRIGVEVDSRTWAYIESGLDYFIPLPLGLTMQKVLGYIGAVFGGNWIITSENKLRFVPLLSAANADTANDDSKVNVLGILRKINTSDSLSISGVSMSNGTDTFTAGDDSDFLLKTPTNPYATQYIVDSLFEKLGGLVYEPFTLEKAVYDPAAELGDYVISKDDVRSVLYSETSTYNMAFRGDISAPFKAEMEDEYPYTGTAKRVDDIEDELRELITLVADKASIDDLSAVYALIQNLSVEDIKTGIIHSNDYEIKTIPRVYPAKTLYPSNSLYPSNGETVLRGFAIDFSSGVIYGAFYSEQIAALEESIAGYDEKIAEIDGKVSEWDNVINNVDKRLNEQDRKLEEYNDILNAYDLAIEDLQSGMSEISKTVEDIKALLEKANKSLLYPKNFTNPISNNEEV